MSANIKKAYKDIVELLQADQDAPISSVLPQILEIASAKSGGGGSRSTTFHKNEDGVIVGIKCYYYKTWMSPEVVEFGSKASSATGLNSMCKEGTSHWTKQQATFKKAKESLLDEVASGQVGAGDVKAIVEELEAEKDAIVAMDREDGYQGFDTLEELLEDNNARGIAA